MSKIRAYVSHSIRGKHGKDATDEQMEANNQRAIEFGKKLKTQFPTVDFYIPAEHDEFVLLAYRKGFLNEDQILNVDCDILAKRHFLIAYCPDDYISKGMFIEIGKAQKLRIPVFYVYSNIMNEAPIRTIAQYLEDLKR